MYIDKPKIWRGAGTLFNELPYVGPAWYPRVATEYLLHMGRVSWTDIKWGLQASAHLPHDIFRKPLDIIEQTWHDIGDAGTTLAKMSVNCCIGFLGLGERNVWRCKTCNELEEGKGADMMVVTHYNEVDSVVDHLFETKIASNTSQRPIYDIAVFTEFVRLA